MSSRSMQMGSAWSARQPVGITSALVKFMMRRFLLTSSGALFLGSTGAFFLFVPLMSIVTVALMLGGLMLMFGLGFQAGAHEVVPAENVGTGVLY